MKGKIFNAQEVQAILNGSKVMFREVVKNANYDSPVHSYKDWENNGLYYPVATLVDEDGAQTETQYSFNAIKCPYQVGQKIFVKEAFDPEMEFEDELRNNLTCNILSYKADFDKNNYYFGNWKSPVHMKQEHSRLTLQIKSVGVERLGDISEEDCWKEGLEEFADYQDQVKVCQMAKQLGECMEDPRPHFATWWNATHKKPEEKFEANPFVWKIQFEVVK